MLSCLALVPFIVPAQAQAYNFIAPNLGLGGPMPCPGNGLVRRIVPCIKETIITAANDFLIPFSTYIADTVSVCIILAVTLWGAMMLSGKGTAPMRDGLMLAIKVGLVLMFTWNFGGNALDPSGTHGGSFGAVLDAMDEMLQFVAWYVINSSWFAFDWACQYWGDTDNVLLIWGTIDCAIETLVGGIYSPITLSMGAIGFLVACLFSNSIGFTIGTMGIYLIFQVLGAIFKCCYIYVSAYMGVAFCVIISPLLIPTVLFTPTKTYFEKWLRLLTSYMVQPIVLFAYLSVLLAAYDTVVYTGPNALFRVIAGNEMDDPFFITTGGLGWWLLGNGMYINIDKAQKAVNVDAKALRNAGLLPQRGNDTGMVGDLANNMLNYAATQQAGVMNYLGVTGGGTGGKPRFFEVDIPSRTVNWEKLAWYHGYPDTITYLLTVLVSAFMALVTGYVFLEMFKVMPFIASGLAMGGGLEEGKKMLAGLGQGGTPIGKDPTQLTRRGSGFGIGKS